MLSVAVAILGMAIWLASLLRDANTGSMLRALVLVLPALVPAALVAALAPQALKLGVGILFLAFAVVTRGHGSRAIDANFEVVTHLDPRVAVTQRQARRNQMFSVALGIAAWALVLLLIHTATR